MGNSSCYTYFKIVGNFDPDKISSILGLIPDKKWSIGDLRSDGRTYEFACWIYGKCECYDVYVENMMMKTIKDLLDKTEILKNIKNNYDVSYYLQIVPEVFVNESTPCLAPNLDIMRFCCETETELDIDLYVFSLET